MRPAHFLFLSIILKINGAPVQSGGSSSVATSTAIRSVEQEGT